MRLAGVVVLYNPEDSVEENINSYIDFLDILYVVDNSEKKNKKLIHSLMKNEKVFYVDNHGNKGIANALNIGAINAIKKKCDYLLTMDQDSKASDGMIDKMLTYIRNHNMNRVGIVTPYQKEEAEKTCYYLKEYETVDIVATSGNILNLNAYRNTGKFLEKLFIDMVDYEYCMRLNMKGYKVVRINSAILIHNLGNTVSRDGYHKVIHSPVRTYYYTRNNLFVRKRYKELFPEITKKMQENLHEFVRTNILYGNHKIKHILYYLRALIDYKLHIYGKIR